MAKMARVFYIFNNPSLTKKVSQLISIYSNPLTFTTHSLTSYVCIYSQIVKDWHLFVFIAVLVVVDLVILVTFTLTQGIVGGLSASRHENAENPSDVKGVSQY